MIRYSSSLELLATLAFAAALAGCERAAASASADRPSAIATQQYIVGIDISGSRTPSQLQEERLVIEGLIMRMNPGDRIVLIETYRSGVDSAGQWQDSIPAQRIPGTMTGRDRRNLNQFRVVATQMASTFFDLGASKKVMSTDLFHTLYRAADYSKAANGRRTTVVLLSDMLQSTGDVDMEKRGGVPADSWTEALRADGRLPDLRNVCVFVVGADATTSKGSQVRRFWQRYFVASGATFRPENYRNMVADPAEIRCE
jgi:hypothetical protein